MPTTPREVQALSPRLRNNPRVQGVVEALVKARQSAAAARVRARDAQQEADSSVMSTGAGTLAGAAAAGFLDAATGGAGLGPIPGRYVAAAVTLAAGVALDSPFIAGAASGMVSADAYSLGARAGTALYTPAESA